MECLKKLVNELKKNSVERPLWVGVVRLLLQSAFIFGSLVLCVTVVEKWGEWAYLLILLYTVLTAPINRIR